jgi:hypothetical protein
MCNQLGPWYRPWDPAQPVECMFTTDIPVVIACGTNQLVNTSRDSQWAKW